VNNAGFRGGIVPSENYTGGCRKDVSISVLDTLYFLPSQMNRSGNKGEGIISVAWPYTKGSGFALNGGGAGNGLFSGGAGGGNYQVGGDGGQQAAACTDLLRGSWAGYACYDLYTQSRRQIIMGGGGGTGVKSATRNATNGGDGGGIVIIISGTLKSNNRSILANGETVTAGATASGGGGGAGGTVLLDITTYTGSLSVGVRGGNGGRTTDGAYCTGSGGGGGGGVVWYSGTSLPGVAVDTLAGNPGTVAGGCTIHVGNGGFKGARRNNLLTPLTGFLFNSIRGTDTLCAGQTPNQLTASQPKGGDGTYTWKWEQSIDMTNWSDAVGPAALKTLQPPALNQTTWYRRIVNSVSPVTAEVIADTSRILEIYVYPAIANNTISGTDTICYNMAGKPLTGTIPTGGNSVYTYQWQYSTNESTWNNNGTTNPHIPGTLQQTTYYRRIVNSTAYCTHTSDTVKITVLPAITNNGFETADTVICANQGPGLLNATTPANGDGLYTYLWQSKSLSGNWTTLASTNVLRYDPGVLNDTMLYRRIVFSGNGNACMDTSGNKSIHVLPLISNNLLESASDRYCAGEIPSLIDGAQPAGGNNSYSYQWRVRTSDTWTTISGAVSADFTPVQQVETNTWFSRIVTSGTYNACRDTSLDFALVVVPYITNHLGAAGQTICEAATPAQLNGAAATGGLGGFTYQWIQFKEGSTAWENAPAVSNLVNYQPEELVVTTLFARKAFSDICTHISDTVAVTVYPAISNNTVLGDAIQYTCYNTSRSLPGSQPSEGNGSYGYLWQQSSNNATWVTAQGTASSLKDLGSEALNTVQYFRRIVYSSPATKECTDTSNTVEVRINPLPSGDVVSSKDTLCAGETLYVKFTVAGLHSPFAVSLGGKTKEGVVSALDSIDFMPLSNQVYTITAVQDDSGCVADISASTGLVEAVVYQVPEAFAGEDDEICANQYTLAAQKSVAGSVGLWTATGVTFDDAQDESAAVTADAYGTSILTWTETIWHCTDQDEVTLVFYEQPQAPDAGPDQVLDFKYSTILEASVPPVGAGQWLAVSGNAVFDNDAEPAAGVSELENTNLLRWTVVNGVCPGVSDSMEITVNPLIIPKGFTPNGDTRNDVFDLGAVNAELIRIKIFNSAGALVYESDDYTNGELWSGFNMNGVELPEGTYFYIADVKVAGRDAPFQFRTFVEILR
jgi:gliding motility-associated-like protein